MLAEAQIGEAIKGRHIGRDQRIVARFEQSQHLARFSTQDPGRRQQPQTLDLFGMTQGIERRQIAAHGVAAEMEALNTYGTGEGRNARELLLDTVMRDVVSTGIAKARQVERNDTEMRRQQTRDHRPVILVGAKAVQ